MLPLLWTAFASAVVGVRARAIVPEPFVRRDCDDSNVGNQTWLQNVVTAIYTLQIWYSEDTGLWTSYDPSWWQSANQLTTVADLANGGSCFGQTLADKVYPITFEKAQAWNEQNGNGLKARGVEQRATGDGFINGYYDDEGWWAMAWIRAYDSTGNTTYLDAALTLFEDMTGGWGNSPCNANDGMWWDKSHSALGTIANVLFLEVAATLANRVPSDQKSSYVEWAETVWLYMNSDQGTYNSTTHIVAGDMDLSTCKVEPQNPPPNYTYTDGALLGGLVELYLATQQQGYLDVANDLAQGVIRLLSVNGVLSEPDIDQASPGQAAPQWKGVFMRALRQLQTVDPNPLYKSYAEACADSIWNNDRNQTAYLGPDWNGPFYQQPNASPQSSALDALIAAWLA